MKKTIFILFLCLTLCSKVYAETHDVKAKYEKNYNVNLIKIPLSNNTQTIKIDKYEVTISSKLKNVEVVIIKPESDANEYIKQITKNIDNYYISFYQDNKKLKNPEITLDIKAAGKKLEVYDNNSNKIDVANNKTTLTSSDYYVSLNNILEEIRKDYKIIDIQATINDIENIVINNNTKIQIYNSKNELINLENPLGTGYKVITNNNNVITEHKIVVKGDITGDANINLNDITRLYHYYKLLTSMDDSFVLAGDVATNDTINLNDITKIYHYHKKFISKL